MNKIAAVFVATVALVTTARAEPILKTQTGNDIGLSLSSYQYQESGVMSSKGPKMGLDMRATKVLQNVSSCAAICVMPLAR